MQSKKLLLIFAFLAITIFAVILIPNRKVVVYSNDATFGQLDISNLTEGQGSKILYEAISKPIYLNIKSKSRAVTLEEIGVSLDSTKLKQLTKTCRSKTLQLFCKSNNIGETSAGDVIVIDREKLSLYLDDLEAELQFLADNTITSFEDYTFRAVSPEATVVLDRSQFLNKRELMEMLSEERLTISLDLTLENLSNQKAVTETLINQMSYPLLIKYGRNPIYIPTDLVSSFLGTIQKDENTYGIVKEDEIQKYLNELHDQYANEDVIVLEKEAVDAIQRALLFRATNYEINNAVILPIEGKPASGGELHDVYLEVVKSQQRLYRFENGELVKTYVVSTGLTWETPPGEYQVLGKQKMTISYFGNWYMPHYLPIGTVYGYRFGFHAIPYHLDATGNIYSRDPNTMGSPATGGCIQLTPEEARELFEWAEVGTPVYIYE